MHHTLVWGCFRQQHPFEYLAPFGRDESRNDSDSREHPAVSEAVVSHSANRAKDALNPKPWVLIPGFCCLSVDGNVLAKSVKRQEVLSEIKCVPLFGKIVARIDLQRQLFNRA